jgi:hypothetical protein
MYGCTRSPTQAVVCSLCCTVTCVIKIAAVLILAWHVPAQQQTNEQTMLLLLLSRSSRCWVAMLVLAAAMCSNVSRT